MSHSHAQTLPKGALVIACTLAVGVVAVVSAMRIFDVPPSASPVAMRAEQKIAPVASRNLRFVDMADGGVAIIDTDSGTTAHTIVPGLETGFIRGVMRGLARDRMKRGIGNEAPFTLTSWADGQLSLRDTATGQMLELTAFGSTNRADFAALLEPAK